VRRQILDLVLDEIINFIPLQANPYGLPDVTKYDILDVEDWNQPKHSGKTSSGVVESTDVPVEEENVWSLTSCVGVGVTDGMAPSPVDPFVLITEIKLH